MGIQKCKVCNHQFTYKEIFISFFNIFNRVYCSKCHTKHILMVYVRLLNGLLTPLLLFSVLLLPWPLSLLLIILDVLIFPYYARYHPAD